MRWSPPSSGSPRLIHTGVPDISRRSGLVEAGINARTYPSHVSGSPRLVDPGISADIPGRPGLVHARINARTHASNVSSGSGLIHTGVPAHISRRAGLVESSITGAQRSRQACHYRHDDQYGDPLVASSCFVHLSLLHLLVEFTLPEPLRRNRLSRNRHELRRQPHGKRASSAA
jgi:hypothetical protein